MIPERFRSLPAPALKRPLVASLVEHGYAIARKAASPCEIVRMSRSLDERFDRTPFSVGAFHGERTKRFHRLLMRCPGADSLVLNRDVLGAVRAILSPWCDFPELNLTQGVEIHPGAPAQIPHCDQNMWPFPKGGFECSVNIFWPMVPFRRENGATRVWPGTHLAPRDPNSPLGEPKICEMEPGDALLVLGSTVHAAGANLSQVPRRAAIVSYALGWLKTYENQSLAYPIEFVRTLGPELRQLLGYCWHRPNLGTYDGQCPSILLEKHVPDYLATKDALTSEHERILQQHLDKRDDCTARAA